MEKQEIIDMDLGEDGVYEPAGEVQEPIRRKEKKHRAERIYRNVREKHPESFLDGFGIGIRLVGGMKRKLEDLINDALREED